MQLYTDANGYRWLKGQDENGGDIAINTGMAGSYIVAVADQVSETVVRVTMLTFPRIADSFNIQGTVSELLDLIAPAPPE